LDLGTSFQLGFQDPGSRLMENLIDLHHDVMFLLIFIVDEMFIIIEY